MEEKRMVQAQSAHVNEHDDDIPVGRVWTRREIMSLSASAMLIGGAASAFGQEKEAQAKKLDLVATPEQTEGPFFVDEKLKRVNLLEGAKRETVLKGVPMRLEVSVYGRSGSDWKPMQGAYVDVWHCCTAGLYSDEASNPIQRESTKGEKWLRGYQVSDAKGLVGFDTIYPGCYRGRTTHIHFKIRTYASDGDVTREFTSQMYFPDELSDKVFEAEPYKSAPRATWNRNDGIYQARQADGTPMGKHLMLNMSKDGPGKHVARFNVALIDD